VAQFGSGCYVICHGSVLQHCTTYTQDHFMTLTCDDWLRTRTHSHQVGCHKSVLGPLNIVLAVDSSAFELRLDAFK